MNSNSSKLLFDYLNIFSTDGNTSFFDLGTNSNNNKNTIREIDKVYQNDPVTVVIWDDGSKTIVKAGPHDHFDPETGILWAFYLKHAKGTKTKLQKKIMKFVKPE